MPTPSGGGVHTLINDTIDDDEISNTSTWSSEKINDEISNTKSELHLEIQATASPVNLLDNSDFTNPVNQREFTNGTVEPYSYFIDRWRNGSQPNSISLNDGIVINNGISQPIILDKYIGKYATMVIYSDIEHAIAYCSGILTPSIEWTSIATSSGNECNITCSNNVFQCGIYVSCKFAALYIGQYDSSILPNYHPKGYSIELAECKRYYRVNKGHYLPFQSYAPHHAILSIADGPMRIVPTISISLGTIYGGPNGELINIENLQYAPVNSLGDMVKIHIIDSQGRFIANTTYFLRDAVIVLTADL